MIEARRLQSRFADGLIREEVQDLWEPWMRQADAILQDEALLQLVYEALGQRAPKSKTRGRRGTPAEQVLRLLVLKHARDWSFEVVVREVRANLVYREFTRVGGDKVPDDKTLGRVARQLGPTVIEQIHQRLVAIAQQKKVVSGRKLRVDTTIVETNIHYPTDSSLMKDGVRVLTRVMKKVTAVTEEVKTQVRDRTRSVKKSVIESDRAARNKTAKGQQKLKEGYQKLLESTRRVVGQAKQVVQEIVQGNQPTSEKVAGVLQNAKRELESMIPRVQQVMRQTRQRLLVCLRRRPRLSAKAKLPSPLSSASWSRFGKRRIRSSLTMKCSTSAPVTPTCWCPPLHNTSSNWAVSQKWWPPTLDFSRPRTKPRRPTWEFGRSRCRKSGPKTGSAANDKKLAGLRRPRNGAPAGRDASVCSNAATA